MAPHVRARGLGAPLAASTGFAAFVLIACASRPGAEVPVLSPTGHVGTVRASCGPTDGAATSFVIAEAGSLRCADGSHPSGAHLLLEIWGSPPMGGGTILLRGEQGHAQRCVDGRCAALEDARLDLAPDHESGDVIYTFGDVERRIHFTTVRCEQRLICG